jgi:poly-gamma-glutamate capsule biosynthesis protein CapA/YwtB (metallophosphatase superfamily)
MTALNWEQGTWRSTRREAAAEVIIASDWAPIRDFGPIIAQAPEAVYGDLMPFLRQADLRIANLECPLTSRGAPVWKSGSVLKGAPEHVRGLTSVPFEIVTLGNNHIFDYGLEGFEQTIGLLDAHHIRWTGAGRTAEEAQRPLVIDLNGTRLGIVNFSEGEDLTAAVDGPGVFGWELERVVQIIAGLKQQVDVILVIAHCGVEYIAFPPVYVAQAFQRIARAGADMIIGHHPHVPQGIRIYDGVPICYSLGNFVFYQQTELAFRKMGYLVKAGLSPSGLTGFSVLPYDILADRLTLMQTEKKQRFLADLRSVSLPLDEDRTIAEAWDGFLCHYGLQGFEEEIRMLLHALAEEPLKGAAMFRNRIATMQHNQHWIDALTRIIQGRIDDAPPWAVELTEQWLTRTR